MSSTILYKFRSGQTFEALPLPGSAARLFDVKKAIVIAKKLDQGSMDFDLSVRDATTNEEYTDDAMLLPRGTRLVVKRLPVPPNAKGQGLLAKIARSQYYGIAATGSNQTQHQQAGTTAPHDFYTIDGSVRDDEDEFVSSAAQEADEEKELAALRAATDSAAVSNSLVASGMGRGMRPNAPGFRPGLPPPGPGVGGPPPTRPGSQPSQSNTRYRPNADPELREQEKQGMPKKRATGIPRTFLNLKPNSSADGGVGDGAEGSGADSLPLLQPNTIGFEELVHRGGGQSENAIGTKHDFEYALKLTATNIPDYLQCPLCRLIVKNAVILTWDEEGRTTCEKCIRDALTNNGFRCPLTGQEGVSPDDLIPNKGLRKAASEFVKDVMSKMEEIEKHHVDDDIVDTEVVGTTTTGEFLEGDGTEKGVILSRRASAAEKKKKQEENDPFGSAGDDPFGGDVFAVRANKSDDEEDVGAGETIEVKQSDDTKVDVPQEEEPPSRQRDTEEHTTENSIAAADIPNSVQEDEHMEDMPNNDSAANLDWNDPGHPTLSHTIPPSRTMEAHRGGHVNRAPYRRPGPPAGYTMGPAGAAMDMPESNNEVQSGGNQSNYRPRYQQTNFAETTDTGHRGGRSGGRYMDNSGRSFRFGDNSGRGNRFANSGRGNRVADGTVVENTGYGGRFGEVGGRSSRYGDRFGRGGGYRDGAGRGGRHNENLHGRYSDAGRSGRFSDGSGNNENLDYVGGRQTNHEEDFEHEPRLRDGSGRGNGRMARGTGRTNDDVQKREQNITGGQEGITSNCGTAREGGRYTHRGRGRGRSYDGRSRGGRFSDTANRYHSGRYQHGRASQDEEDAESNHERSTNIRADEIVASARNDDDDLRSHKRPRSESDARSDDVSSYSQQQHNNRSDSVPHGDRGGFSARGGRNSGRFRGGYRGGRNDYSNRGSNGGGFRGGRGRY